MYYSKTKKKKNQHEKNFLNNKTLINIVCFIFLNILYIIIYF